MPAPSALDQLKAAAANVEGFGESPDPEPAQGDRSDLDDELGEGGEPATGTELGETKPEGAAPLDGEEPPADAAEKASAAEDAALLGEEKLVKQGKGEFIPKAAFLKRLKKESAKAKELEAKLKPFTEKAADYQHWDKYSKAYRETAQYVERLRPVFQQDPWLAKIIEDRLAGKPVDWRAITSNLKPFLAPFWDGVADAEVLDPATQALKRTETLEQQLKTWQETQTREQARIQQEQQSRQNTERYQQTFATLEKSVWEKHPKYKSAHYRNLLYDKAEVAQNQLDEEGQGRIVDLRLVADDLFGAFNKLEEERTRKSQDARNRARRAAGEGSGGLPGSPIPAEPKAPADGKPVDFRRSLRDRIVAAAGTKFTE